MLKDKNGSLKNERKASWVDSSFLCHAMDSRSWVTQLVRNRTEPRPKVGLTSDLNILFNIPSEISLCTEKQVFFVLNMTLFSVKTRGDQKHCSLLPPW